MEGDKDIDQLSLQNRFLNLDRSRWIKSG